LQLKRSDVFVDATLGGAGHSLCLAQDLLPDGVLVGIDRDPQAVKAATERLRGAFSKLDTQVFNSGFEQLDEVLVEAAVPGIDGILFDLGASSHQFDTPSRGFAYSADAPLDMRMNPGKQTINAAEVINQYNAEDLARIFLDFGEERWVARIAEFIVRERAKAPIEGSADLVRVINAAIPAKARAEGGHPAKRVFQALRIEVNGELEALQKGLDAAVRWLLPGGRIVVISYHSLEDRIVKQAFASHAKGCICPDDIPQCVCGRVPVLNILTKKAVRPSVEEVEANKRAKSAKLRAAERL
jgi:16S rRNA (cytosine1402-N4)-methyltransferase